ncbi:helix-turn-helix domain-containing protein [Clostridium paraputrificum]|uniref:helix-turn-helix domain-containing protein n=1 Tax=Clostridium paraputrificum TaxID=29363 RepID=UPI00189F3210|nr:helix-turn-helix transcriptional regulator [Clostridium paraputrificum]
MSIGMKIKELRKKKGVARSELAEKVGLSKYAIIKYEQGQRTPKVDILVKISEALNVNFIEFLSCYDISTEFKNLSEEDERKKRSKLEEFSLKELFEEILRRLEENQI